MGTSMIKVFRSNHINHGPSQEYNYHLIYQKDYLEENKSKLILYLIFPSAFIFNQQTHEFPDRPIHFSRELEYCSNGISKLGYS